VVGVRLDSGDLDYLNIEARRILDANGCDDAAIVASNELDETVIGSLMEQGAALSNCRRVTRTAPWRSFGLQACPSCGAHLYEPTRRHLAA
jgi:hypothetical protein